MTFKSLKAAKNDIKSFYERKEESKAKLITIINNIHKIDEIPYTLNYKVKEDSNRDRSLLKIDRFLHNDDNITSITDKNDLVYKFRHKGIVIYCTLSTDSLTSNDALLKSQMWDVVVKEWKSEMTNWVNNQVVKLTTEDSVFLNSEFKIEGSSNEFAKEIENELNNNIDGLKVVDSTNNKNYITVTNILTIDLSTDK